MATDEEREEMEGECYKKQEAAAMKVRAAA
jgi:hypothetical protein